MERGREICHARGKYTLDLHVMCQEAELEFS